MEYIRNPNCECQKYLDFDDITNRLKERSSIKEYFLGGYIHEKDSSRECNCHKTWRLNNRYEILAHQKGLPTISKLEELPYLGDTAMYSKFYAIPDIMESKPEHKNTIFYCLGGRVSQKTTSAAKLILKICQMGKYPEYFIFNDLIQDLNENDNKASLQKIRDADYLIIDDCFTADVINFRSCYNLILTEILKRKKPTILFSRKSFDEISSNTHYDKDLVDDLKGRVTYKNSLLYFKDNVENIMLKANGPIDLWS